MQAIIVYQGEIANVFKGEDLTSRRRKCVTRLLQADFHTCESFAAGMQAAGMAVWAAWCNQAGDIIDSKWRFDSFQDAPFHDSMHYLRFLTRELA